MRLGDGHVIDIERRQRRVAQAQRLEGRAHRVGGVHAAAAARAGDRQAFDLAEVLLAHLAGAELAHGLEDADDVQVLALVVAGQDRAADHLDAPMHFVANGAPIDRVELTRLIGEARVIEIPDSVRVIDADIEELDLEARQDIHDHPVLVEHVIGEAALRAVRRQKLEERRVAQILFQVDPTVEGFGVDLGHRQAGAPEVAGASRGRAGEDCCHLE